MMRSMFAGVSGLRNHQTRMDVIGNNIANVNTAGFKKSRVTFQDMLNQTVQGASSPQGSRGGTNPQQVGLGMTIASIDTIQTQGNLQSTGKMTDLAVQGDGFFMLGIGSDIIYTRAGNFDVDTNGNLVNPAGLKVQGWKPNSSGVIDTNSALTGLTIVKGDTMAPTATANVAFANNLDVNTVIDATVPPAGPTVYHPLAVTVYDSLGVAKELNIRIAKTAANTWNAYIDTSDSAWATMGATTITFNADGSFNGAAGGVITLTHTNGATSPQTVNANFARLTQYASESTARSVEPIVPATAEPGNAPGVLSTYTIDKSGVITGVYSNGLNKVLGQVALANFDNPAGLIKEGENLYRKSNNSGEPDVGAAGKGGRGGISPGSLEMSNVDLSQEFTDMIITQRGFQANSRIITTSDEMLQELVNLKR
ncbi:MAG: flagellar basal-body rod protein FlgF [Clostridia bacterium]|nr:flagellar basal-body rod protein FlgF [Clostridia bacterium]